ncbi:MAG: FecR domain-containing protein [Legionella sp.]|nr:FecR domain-containing protein [Legionella sp.]
MFKKANVFIYSLLILLTLSIHPAYSDNRMDLPGVARLSYINGSVSFLPAGESRWVKANLNRPLVNGDRLWSGDKSFLELQFETATLRMGNMTSVKILSINEKMSQLQLSTGTIIIRVWPSKTKKMFEVSTPNLAFTIIEPGVYRVSVNSQSKITLVSVIRGNGRVYGYKGAFQINQGRSCPFGPNLQMYRCTKILAPDSLESWSLKRDSLRKGTYKYVSSEMIGFEDLERYGRWRVSTKYGNVWVPTVEAGWVPYRNGHWTWIRHWGWTWVDNYPWGFAPFHYGRWAFLEGRWSWVPGRRNIQPVYAPALVVFVGGANFNLKLPTGNLGIAWFPLAPGEIYLPPRHINRDYFFRVNIGHTQRSMPFLTAIFNNRNTNVVYQNAQLNSAISAVPTQTFVHSQPVHQAIVPMPSQAIINAPKIQAAPVAPEKSSGLGGKGMDVTQPPSNVIDQPGVVTVQPPALAPSDEKKQENPGDPVPVQQPDQSLPKSADEPKLQVVDPNQKAVPLDKELTDKLPTISNPALPQEVKPEDPVQSIEPIKPDDAVKPEAPIQTQEPLQPDSQVKPEQPVQPAEPIKPVQPEAAPTKPEEPIQPEAAPTKPEEPIQPEAAPTKPEEPIQPEAVPIKPEEPIQPEAVPIKPEEPIQPEVAPTKPEEPVQPSAPNPSEESVHPETPMNSDQPVPGAQIQPDQPLAPEAPKQLEQPVQPN